MAIKTKCQTPEAVFHTTITDRQVTVAVELPFHLNLTEEAATQLEANLHNAMEMVLARYFHT